VVQRTATRYAPAVLVPALWSLLVLALSAAPAWSEPPDGIPIVELPATGPGEALAVIYSGDGGWRDIDKQIGEILAREGGPVVGIDCLRYFWRARQPGGLARDLRRILAHYRVAWGRRRVLLVGYSFGADVLPFIVNRLPTNAQRDVVQISLLGLGSRASFEFHVSDWLRKAPRPGDLPVLPEAAKLDQPRVQCFYGADEDDTLCPELARRGAEVIRTTGGHHFDGDYAALARHIRDGLARRTAGSQ
jgi:type IV secretory pathway VirJ component